MQVLKLTLATSISLLCIACASPSRNNDVPQTPQASSSKARIVKSKDGTFTGEMVGKAAAGSKFAKLQIGMDMNEVQDIVGRGPDRMHTYESGKRWIPFYFGNDARRMQVLYKNEGCLIFTGGNVWGGAGGDLVQIEADPSGKCYQP
ncbi:hypothetical protein Q8A64_10640 [Oxalobacteraceae bacterium R-40]|uniref:Lipoprotein SmpA/OmlA domain-containing protein n=1 Tax=Keguizhuia sedimenti TaxID=3064264 RepID=A0ABU1BPD6_9BURK|nr:hypothetical protein [Oxalobacteraceae bacterium R-40]